MTKKGERPHAASLEGMFKSFGEIGVEVVSRIEPVEKQPTGILSFDLTMHGGIPKNRVMLWYGNEGSGKTTTWLLIARQYMRQGLPVLWIDAERTIERGYMELLGMEPDATLDGKPLFTLVKPQTAEQALDAIIMALELKYHKLIVIDTLAKLVPAVEKAASVSKAEMGVAARLYSRGTRVWSEPLEKSGATLVILNQERVDMGTYGAPKVSTGGNAISKHEPSITVSTQRNSNLYADGRPTRLIFNYTVRKTKVFPPTGIVNLKDYHQLHIRCQDDVYEIDYPYELFFAARRLGILRDKDGGVWKKNVAYFEGEKIGNGQDAIEKWFDDESELRDRIEAAVFARMESGDYGYQGSTEAVQGSETGDPEPEFEAYAPEFD